MKLSPVVLIILVVIAGLILLYLIARKVKPVGHSLGFVCAVAGRILVKITEFMTKAADYCYKACIASLRYPPGVTESDYWSGINVLSRLVYFVLGVCILVGESVNTLLVLPALLLITSNVHLPGIVELTSAALFICCPALAGAAIFELCGLIPHGAGLFPRLSKGVRWVLGVVCAVVLILAILETGYFYVYRALYILSPDSTQGMSMYILGGLGLETAAMAVLALWCIVVGGAGVVSLIMWAVEMIAHGIAAFASLPPHQLDTLALHLTGGHIGVWGEQIARPPHKFPTFQAGTSSASLPGQTSVVELPEHASSIDAETDVEIVPVLTHALEGKMSKHPDCNASLVFVGSYASKVRPYVLRKLDELQAKGSILSGGYLDLSINHIPTAIPGIVDISPTVAERRAATMHGRTEDEIYTTLLHLLVDKLVETHRPTRAAPGSFTFIVDPHKLVDFANVAESIKHRYPLHSVHVVTSISEQAAQNPTVHTGMVDMQSLVAEDILETVFLTSPRSSFASAYGEQTQHNFLAQALVSLILGHKHSLSNPTFTSVLQELHSLSPFATFSFASEAIALGDVPSRLKWIPGVSGAAGAHTGDFSDIVLQARTTATRVLTDPATRAFDAEVSSDLSCFVLFNKPIALNDARSPEFDRDMALWVGSNFPFASSISVRGNGCAYPYHLGGKFLVQATAIYPLQPASFPRLQSSKTVKVTPLYPVTTALEPARSNGQKGVGEQTSKAKQTKAVTSSRQRKSSPPRRVARKNAKQAQ